LSVKIDKDSTRYVNIGATQHMSFDKKTFISYEEWDKGHVVYQSDNSTQDKHGQGEVTIKLNNGDIKEITNVLFVPGLKKIYSLLNNL
jgi:hypothetical protein